MNEQALDITKLSIIDLKALAYDQISQIEQFQNNLRTVNAQIQIKLKEIKTPIINVPPVNDSTNG